MNKFYAVSYNIADLLLNCSLLHGWHCNLGLAMSNILFAPHLRHSFKLGIEIDSLQKKSKSIENYL